MRTYLLKEKLRQYRKEKTNNDLNRKKNPLLNFAFQCKVLEVDLYAFLVLFGRNSKLCFFQFNEIMSDERQQTDEWFELSVKAKKVI